eukprot:4809620-Prymnesium_polylepis.1
MAAMYMSRMSKLPFGYSSAVQVPAQPLKRRPLGPKLNDLAQDATLSSPEAAAAYEALVGVERLAGVERHQRRPLKPQPPPGRGSPPPHTFLLFEPHPT